MIKSPVTVGAGKRIYNAFKISFTLLSILHAKPVMKWKVPNAITQAMTSMPYETLKENQLRRFVQNENNFQSNNLNTSEASDISCLFEFQMFSFFSMGRFRNRKITFWSQLSAFALELTLTIVKLKLWIFFISGEQVS
jgi:hypothetical protein